VLEAMASGVPVLTSSAGSLPEIARDAEGPLALLADPLDESALRDGLERLLLDTPWRDTASARGLARARGMGWDRCVEATVAVYREVLAAR
jgi:alpha-1,3-rhamnosyl/mannosyltransferase